MLPDNRISILSESMERLTNREEAPLFSNFSISSLRYHRKNIIIMCDMRKKAVIWQF